MLEHEGHDARDHVPPQVHAQLGGTKSDQESGWEVATQSPCMHTCKRHRCQRGAGPVASAQMVCQLHVGAGLQGPTNPSAVGGAHTWQTRVLWARSKHFG